MEAKERPDRHDHGAGPEALLAPPKTANRSRFPSETVLILRLQDPRNRRVLEGAGSGSPIPGKSADHAQEISNSAND